MVYIPVTLLILRLAVSRLLFQDDSASETGSVHIFRRRVGEAPTQLGL